MKTILCSRCTERKYCKYSTKPFQPNISMKAKATREAFDEFRKKCDEGMGKFKARRL